METVFISGVAIISKGLLTGVINDVYQTVKKSSENTYFAEIVENMEILIDIQIIEALLADIEKHGAYEYNVVQICIKHISDIIEKIKNELESLNLKIVDQHYSKYYISSFIAPNYEEHLTKLKRYKENLSKKVDFLVKILSIKLSIKNNSIIKNDLLDL